jgi:hypothetical protein
MTFPISAKGLKRLGLLLELELDFDDITEEFIKLLELLLDDGAIELFMLLAARLLMGELLFTELLTELFIELITELATELFGLLLLGLEDGESTEERTDEFSTDAADELEVTTITELDERVPSLLVLLFQLRI